MKSWREYKNHKKNIVGKRKKFDNNIYSFDIETSSFFTLNDKIYPASSYLEISEKDKKNVEYYSNMYIWQFSINDEVYFGRTWEDFKLFLNKLEENIPEKKYIFVHNLSFEFQYLKSYFHFNEVQARKAHKVITATMSDYNIEFRCSYMMSNVALKYLPKIYDLPVEKKVGDLDYLLLRHSGSPLTEKELGYCEYDCLVVYHYIKRELETYETVKNIPITSTGKVRRELKERVLKDFAYKRKVRAAINTDPHVYNLLQDAFMGGYTHANYIYADEVLENITSFDETSAYPYVLVTEKFPSREFQKCNLKSLDYLSEHFAYILHLKFKNINSLYDNHILSASKCKNIVRGVYDNGRIIKADELEVVITDIDYYLINKAYSYDEVEVIECYYSSYNYLPLPFIKFVLEKYVAKTKLKNVKGKELDYQKEKNKFNSLYGMSVTNTIRDEVIFDDESKTWEEEELSNDEIIEKLNKEKDKAFLSFGYGVWVTAYARRNLLERVLELDKYVVYCDTDSIKLLPGFDKNIFIKYNESVISKIKYVSSLLGLDAESYAPKDIKGNKHILGTFENDANYDEFITQGAKKYAYKEDGEINITVSGVPKCGAKVLHNLSEFKDDLVFPHEITNKNILMYVDDEKPIILTDFMGNKLQVNDKSGACCLPTTYILGKSMEYADFINDASSKRARFKE